MADKEERIYVGIINPKGDFCPVPYGTCNSLCDNCKGGMTRQEAIEKMAKGIHHYEWYFDEKELPFWEELNEDIRQDYRNQAEAALNALLGVEK